MPRLYILAAGHRLKLMGERSELLSRFADRIRLLGIQVDASSRACGSASDFMVKYGAAAQDLDFVVVVNQMEDFEEVQEDIGKAVLKNWVDQAPALHRGALDHLLKKHPNLDPDAPVPEALTQMALLPAGCDAVNDPEGGPPGFVTKIGKQVFFFFPHKLAPLAHMLEHCAQPLLCRRMGRQLASASFVADGLPPLQLETRMNAILKALEGGPVCYHRIPAAGAVQVSITACGDDEESARALAERVAGEALEALWPFAHQPGEQAQEILAQMLRKNKLTLAGAFPGREYAEEFERRMPGVFQYRVNAGPPKVRELALEVPREFMHQNGGMNREAALYMAYHVSRLYKTGAGFSLLLLPDQEQMALGIASGDLADAVLLEAPADSPDHSRMDSLVHSVLLFLRDSLHQWPDGLTDAVPVSRLTQEEETASIGKALGARLRRRRRGAE